MITVHNLENSQSIRILWLLEELGEAYSIQQYSREAETSLAPSEFKKLHPMGTAPTITDGKIVLAETNAIMDHILDQHAESALRPRSGSAERDRYLYWFHATQGSLMPLLIDTLILSRMVTKAPGILRPLMRMITGKVMATFVQPRCDRILRYMEDSLATGQWLAGETFTAADIVMGYCLEVLYARSQGMEAYPNIAAYRQRLHARPAYQCALEKNGSFAPIAS